MSTLYAVTAQRNAIRPLTRRDLHRLARESTIAPAESATTARTNRPLYFGVRHEVVTDWTWIERAQLAVLVRAADARGDIAEGGRLLGLHHELVLARNARYLAGGEPREPEPTRATPPPSAASRVIRTLYASVCRHCGNEVRAGEVCLWRRGVGVAHLACGDL